MPILEEFSDFLATEWREPQQIDAATAHKEDIRPFLPENCHYRPWHWYEHSRSLHWMNWICGGAATCSLLLPRPARQKYWWCSSLQEASKHYSWPGNSYFGILVSSITSNIGIYDNAAVEKDCYEIFNWGGVGRFPGDPSLIWVQSAAAAGTLISGINDAVNYLTSYGVPVPAPSPFAPYPGTLLMNATITKVYAACDPNVLIYDGRVGAALCLLVKRFLSLKSPVPTATPPGLIFHWSNGAGGGNRNPNSLTPTGRAYNFPQQNQTRVTDANRAEAARRAAYVVKSAARKVGTTVRDFEKGLFMIGYHIHL